MYTLAIIDDEPLIQLGIHSLVHYQELSLSPCEFVHTGPDALTLIHSQKPDIVLLDISIPGIDGLSIIRQIRKTANELPVFILLTNMDDFSYVQTALRLGVLDFITKIEVKSMPFEKIHLLNQFPVILHTETLRVFFSINY